MNGAYDIIYKVGVMSYIQLVRDDKQSGCDDTDTVDAMSDIVGVMS